MFARRYATKGDPRSRRVFRRRTFKRSHAVAYSRYAAGRRRVLGAARSAPQGGGSGPTAVEAKSDELLQSLIGAELSKLDTTPTQPLISLKPAETKDEKKDDVAFEDDEGKTVPADLRILKGMLTVPGGVRRIFKFRIGQTLQVSTNGAGFVNAIIFNSNLATILAFNTGLGSLFDEFFVESQTARFMPNSLFQYPESTPISGQNANSPWGVVDLQNQMSSYSSTALMAQNPRMKWTSTGMPFTYVWRNVERYKAGVSSTSTTLTQNWTNFSNVTNYTGGIQFLTTGASPIAFSDVVGTIAVSWLVLCRLRS